MRKVEAGLTLLGCTAIEDKLQTGVPRAIADLSRGGIKVWVLTGDKEETAINIGFACSLLTTEMEQVVINLSTHPTLADIKKELAAAAKKAMPSARAREAAARGGAIHHAGSAGGSAGGDGGGGGGGAEWSLVIDGEALELALAPEEGCAAELLALGNACVAVVCCRVSPAQKAEIVNLVRAGVADSRCLSIGDGANDVAMIQAAHIGVGISGQEGLQAVNASDYAIAQFRFLKRLVLVHGRWNYRRLAKLVCYMFYKNIMLVLAQWCFTFFNANSGQKFYLEFGTQLYNLCLTAIPVLVLGVLDQDLPAAVVETQPETYRPGLLNMHFSDRIFWGWMGATVIDAAVIFGSAFAVYHGGGMHGDDLGMWQLGALVFTMVVVVANTRLAWHVYIFQAIQPVFFIGSVVLWFGIAASVSRLVNGLGGLGAGFLQSWDWYFVFPTLMARPAFWYSLALCTVVTNASYFWSKGYKRAFGARLYHGTFVVVIGPLLAPSHPQLLAHMWHALLFTSHPFTQVLQEIVKMQGADAAAYIEDQRHASVRNTSSFGSVDGHHSPDGVTNPVRIEIREVSDSRGEAASEELKRKKRVIRSTSLCYDEKSHMAESFLTTSQGGTSYRAPLRAGTGSDKEMNLSLAGIVQRSDTSALPQRLVVTAPPAIGAQASIALGSPV